MTKVRSGYNDIIFTFFLATVSNHLRDFQHLEDSTLPTSLQNHGNTMLRVSSPGQCAQECLQRKEWCRAFTYAPTQCNLYKGSILIANVDPVTKDGTHLYSLSKSVVRYFDWSIKDRIILLMYKRSLGWS